jgi:hypothetical protein
VPIIRAMMMKAASTAETSVFYNEATAQKSLIFKLAAVRT